MTKKFAPPIEQVPLNLFHLVEFIFVFCSPPPFNFATLDLIFGWCKFLNYFGGHKKKKFRIRMGLLKSSKPTPHLYGTVNARASLVFVRFFFLFFHIKCHSINFYLIWPLCHAVSLGRIL